ncbi:MAG: hypothetical protein ACPGQO_03380 [Candidatus Poseidoniaceae archaeon]
MNTRPVRGWALPATALTVFEDQDERYVVLNDGRMMRCDAEHAPTHVLGSGPRPLGVIGDVVLTNDGSTAKIGDLSVRHEDLEGTGLVIAVDGALVTLDEGGVVQRWTPDGQRALATGVQSLFDAHDGSILVTQGDALAVHAIDGTGLVWTRPVRGNHGERITAAVLVPGGGALVAREGYAMTGEEDVVEIERWGDDALLWRQAHSEVILGLASTSIGVLAHDQAGSVLLLTAEATTELHHAGSGVRDWLDLGGEVCIAAWFHVHGINGAGLSWTVEHPGMPSALSLFGSQLLVVGDDGNDWTGPEPLAVVDLDGAVVEVDPSELTAWVPPPLEEKDEIPRMVEASLPVDEAPVHDWNAPSGLLDALEERAPEAKAATDDDEDLLAALTQDGPQTVASAFSVDLGEEQEVHVDEGGVAEVLLEAKVAGAPELGVIYAWSTSDGREIGTKARLLLRLPRGSHRFELRARHPDGRWAMDSVHIRVV